jgi:TPR repeat protein
MKKSWILALSLVATLARSEEPLATIPDATVYDQLAPKLPPEKFAEISKRAEAGDAASIDAMFLCNQYGFGTLCNAREAREWLKRGIAKRSPVAVLFQAKCFAGYWLEPYGNDPEESKRLVQQVLPFFRSQAANGSVMGETLLGMALWVGKDKEALTRFKKSADAGEVIAQLNLGDALFNGDSVQENRAEALALFRKAADQNSAMGYNDLGAWYFNSDPDQAAKHYLKAAQLGYAPAAETIGLFYRDGRGVDPDPLEAVRWLSVSERVGLHHFRYFDTYDREDPDYTKRTPAEIVKWFVDKAEAGAIPQMEAVGLFYFSGFGLPQDSHKAAAILEKAAALGDPQSASDLTEVYGSTGENDKLFEISRKIAAKGGAREQVSLAVCYERGLGTPKDYKKALECYEKAVELGYGDPNGKVAEMRGLANAFGAELDKLAAVEKDANAGNVRSMMRMAANYENGNLVARDMKKVVAWEEKAAAAGSIDACAKLGDRYANGKSVEIHLHKAYDYLQKAAASGEARHQYTFGAFLLQNRELKPSAKQDLFEAFLAAAKQGHEESILQVARCYNWAIGTDENCTEAIAWYQKIFNRDFRPKFETGMILVLGRGGVTKDEIRGAKLVEEAAQTPQAGDPQFALGKLYNDGIGVEKDKAKAMLWLKKAKANGNAAAGHLLDDLINPPPPKPVEPAAPVAPKPPAPPSSDF